MRQRPVIHIAPDLYSSKVVLEMTTKEFDVRRLTYADSLDQFFRKGGTVYEGSYNCIRVISIDPLEE